MFAVVVLNYLKEIAGFRRRERGNCKESRRDGKDRKTGHQDLRYHHIWGLGDVYAYEVTALDEV